MMKKLDRNELDQRIRLNFERLSNSSYYQIQEVFSPADYEWYGDKEGRALLSFVSHYKINGTKIECMSQMLEQLPDRVNKDGYFGPIYEEQIHEQQLSGHSWLLRGLCEHYEQFGDETCLYLIDRITKNLYLPKKGSFTNYPLEREDNNFGEVSGTSTVAVGNWILSTDIGCAFMSIDGLSHAYKILKDERIKALLDEMISVYCSIDKVKLKAQTHCTLTAARGMMRMYSETGEEGYLEGAKQIWELYVYGGGITATYQNLNWWGRPDSWTEPCAIVDSLMLSLELYKAIKAEEYRTIAARIYHNGLSTAQRSNGGAGTDSLVLEGVEEKLYAQMYEAYFCCTMRLAEGLWYIKEHAEMLYAHMDGQVTKKGMVYMDGDILYVEASDNLIPYAEDFVEVDGYRLCPIVKYYKTPEEDINAGWQKVFFS